ncbi:MAG: flagellar basal body rod protein FlgB, partial [Anaerotignaceae bacterium]
MFNNSVLVSERLLDYLWQKQEVTMNNIANASTPGFKSQYVTFQDELKRKIGNYESGSQIRNSIGSAKIEVQTKDNESNKLDGNNVNMDVEQAELASTLIQYQYAIKNINDE